MCQVIEGRNGFGIRCCTISQRTSKVPSRKTMPRASLLYITSLLSFAIISNAQEWPYRIVEGAKELKDCEGLGFPNATRNECGFCTGGSTGIFSNYSRDCMGSCTEEKVLDCNGICGGSAYIDECSGRCIGGRTGLSEKDIEAYRDCRGYCSSSGGQFFLDSCGVCHTGTSPFQDCTNRCNLPGFEHMMAKLLCGRCVGGTTGVPESEVLDACGNCKSDIVDCPCDGAGKPDECGVCNGGGKSCMKVVKFHPPAFPANSNADIVVEGAFRGRQRNIKCILIKDEINMTEYNGAGNGSFVKCTVRLKEGSYRVGVKLEGNGPSESGYVEETELIVYEEAEYTSMSPTKQIFDRDGLQELTVTFSGGRVPNLPLICIVTGDGWSGSQQMTVVEANTLDTCTIPYPKSSVKLTISPSFNGIHTFKRSFQLKFYASPPEMRESYIAEDGHAIVIAFDRPVNLCDLKECSDILITETLERLGEGASCKWATKQQLIIIVQNPIQINPFRVTFKKNVLKQDGQKYALPKNESRTIDVWYPQPVSNAQVTISGPSTIPFCGVFTLVGHFSSPKGDAEYYWTVFRGDRRPLEGSVADALLGIRTASLTLNATLLEVDLNYTFVLTAEHPVNQKYEAMHVVNRKSYIGPLVTAYSNVMSQSSVTVDERITLQADLTLPDCVVETEVMRLMWTVNNPEVKFDFKSRNLQVYQIQPFALPENTEVIFTAYAYFANMLNVTSSSVRFRVEPFKLKASIKGTAKRVIGNKDGNLVLESEISKVKFPVVYQWKCYENSNPICYNYKKNDTEPLLLPRKMQNKPKLTIPCESLKAGSLLTFELQVFRANNRYQYSQTATTYVVVEDKNIPLAVVDSVIADGAHPIERHPTTGAYSVPAGLPVAVYATVTPVKASLKSVKWEVKGFSSSFTYTTVNGKTILSLEEGFLVSHGIYMIGLSACDGKGACGMANLTIRAVPGIALCKLETEPYVEYEIIKPVVKGCSIPPGRQPVTYQLFLHQSDLIYPLTPPQTPTVFSVIGPAYQSRNGTKMSVEVCDKYSLCTMFPGPKIRVSLNEDIDAVRASTITKAEHHMRMNDQLAALTAYLTVATDPQASLSQDDITNMLNAAAKASANRYINAGQLSLIYSAMLPLLKMSNNKVKLKALDVIRRSTKLAFGYKVKVPTSVLAQGYSNAAEALVQSNSDSSVTNKVKGVLEFFVQKISAVSALGSRTQLSSSNPGFPSSLIFRQLLDRSPIFINAMSRNGIVEGSVRFEEAVRDRVRKRKCEKSTRCDGIVVALTIYPDENPYPASMKKTSPVLDISLRKPEDGEPFIVTDVPNAIRLALSHNTSGIEPNKNFKCSYWDTELKDWASDGLVTFGVDGTLMRCWSSHLTPFAIFEAYDGLSTGSIVGIVVTVLMGVFIIMMLAFFFFRKKQGATARVSNEALQPNRKSDKMQGMNGSVVRVKTITP